MYFDFENKVRAISQDIKAKLGVEPFLELTSLKVSAVLDPDTGNNYKISLLQENVRNKSTDKGVEKNHLFIGFDIAVLLSKETKGQSGQALPVPYADGAIFSMKGTAATSTDAAVPSEFDSLMTLYGGMWDVQDQDGTSIMLPRPMWEFWQSPDTQYSPATASKTMVLPSFDMSKAFRPLFPYIIVSGNKETNINLVLGEGSKKSIGGAAGTQNAIIFNILGVRARNIADTYMVKLAEQKQRS